MTRWGDKRYHSLDFEMKHLFGEKVYKLSLDGGMGCPNRDGTLGYGGCIFCSEGGSGDFAAPRGLPIHLQIEAAKNCSQSKHPTALQIHRLFSGLQQYLRPCFRPQASLRRGAVLSGNCPSVHRHPTGLFFSRCIPSSRELNKKKPSGWNWISNRTRLLSPMDAYRILPKTFRKLRTGTPYRRYQRHCPCHAGNSSGNACRNAAVSKISCISSH